MSERHLAFWPKSLPRRLTLPATSVFHNLEVSARRYPDKPALVFCGRAVTYSRLLCEAEWLAGFLQRQCGVKKGDRVVLYLQNSPQYVLAYYAVLRTDAVVVPVSPMSLTNELRHYLRDSGADVVFTAQDLYARVQPLGVKNVIVATYSEYAGDERDGKVPETVTAPRQEIAGPGVVAWSQALARRLEPLPHCVSPDDLCAMPYTSGTTGAPKGCMHTHRSVMYTLVAGAQWFGVTQDATTLAVLPLFHVTGMQVSMNGPLFSGSTIVIQPRWDREAAAQLIQRYRVNDWTAAPTMVIDFLSDEKLDQYDLSSVGYISGGGAAMPEAIAQRLLDRGITYVEGYGLSEAMGPTHINPRDRAKKQCMGIPLFDVDARVVAPDTLRELPAGEVGEIVIHGPQLFRGYWNNSTATEAALAELGGKRFLRTGDLGRTDEDGYFFIVDRLKRIINTAGYKVSPAEVEAELYYHPGIQEVCVVGARDARRGETVKAVVVLKPGYRERLVEQEIIEWARIRMAAYKYPRLVAFAESLPKSASGKVLWRVLQEQENRN